MTNKQPYLEPAFRGKDYFMSNMYPLANGVETPDGIVVPSVEIGYQADKFADPEARQRVLEAPNGLAAKKLAKHLEREEQVPLREDWDEKKLDVMRWYVRQKFARNDDVAQLLRKTGRKQIIEKNPWGDTYWGVSQAGDGKVQGENHLGKLLMETRADIFDGRDLSQYNNENLGERVRLLLDLAQIDNE